MIRVFTWMLLLASSTSLLLPPMDCTDTHNKAGSNPAVFPNIQCSCKLVITVLGICVRAEKVQSMESSVPSAASRSRS